MDIKIISESQIDIFQGPGLKVRQQVITYQADNLAPRTVWVNTDQISDAQFKERAPGKPVPADIQQKGDLERRKFIEADVARLKAAGGPRKI